MEVKEMLELQEEFDDVVLDRLVKKIRECGEIEGLKTNIITKAMLKNNKILLSMNLLELVTEAAELANSVKSFKYWSNQKPDCREHILEEMVDVFIAAAGISNNLGFTNTEIEKAYRDKIEININRQRDGY